MTRDETIAFWQQCEVARGAALAEGKSEEQAHEAAKCDLECLGGTRCLKRAGHWRHPASLSHEEVRWIRGFCSARNLRSKRRDVGWMQARERNFSRLCF